MGGTYFRNEEWKKKTLGGLYNYYKNKHEDALAFAQKLTLGVQDNKLTFKDAESPEVTREKIDSIVLHWQNYFDTMEGGQDRAPKFPMPGNYEFLLQFASGSKNKFVLNFINLTLHKMAWGGIYDQLGGGFARYSVDALWHVPHFCECEITGLQRNFCP